MCIYHNIYKIIQLKREMFIIVYKFYSLQIHYNGKFYWTLLSLQFFLNSIVVKFEHEHELGDSSFPYALD